MAAGSTLREFAINSELPTGTAFVRYRTSGARDFVFNIKHSAAGRIPFGEIQRRLCETCDHLHVMGTSLFSPALVEIVLEAATTIRRKAGTVSFDPNLRWEMLSLPGLRAAMETLMGLCDVFLPSGDELFLFHAGAGEAAAVEAILRSGVKAVVAKRGAEGCTYFRTLRRAFISRRVRRARWTRPGRAIASAPSSWPPGCAAFRPAKRCGSPPPRARAPSNAKGRWRAPRRPRNWRLSSPSGRAAHELSWKIAGSSKDARGRRLDLHGSSRGDRDSPPARQGERRLCSDRGDLQPGQPGRRLYRHDAGRLPRASCVGIADARRVSTATD